ncbi:MAG: hypothetical protein ACYYKD_12335 [Rhodospirillales bacterium]
MKQVFLAALAALVLLTGAAHAQFYTAVGYCESAAKMKDSLTAKGYRRADSGYAEGRKWYAYSNDRTGQVVGLWAKKKKPNTLCIVPLRGVGGTLPF